eukprot:2188352-Pleurochrysis_carterae.AAC.1
MSCIASTLPDVIVIIATIAHPIIIAERMYTLHIVSKATVSIQLGLALSIVALAYPLFHAPALHLANLA